MNLCDEYPRAVRQCEMSRADNAPVLPSLDLLLWAKVEIWKAFSMWRLNSEYSFLFFESR